MALNPTPDELKDFKKIEKVSVSKRIFALENNNGKGEISKINGNICNTPIQVASMWSILPKAAAPNRLFVANLKRYFQYKGHVYFEPVRSNIIYLALTYLKSYTKFYKDISFAKGHSNK